jgi:hypothetical protein
VTLPRQVQEETVVRAATAAVVTIAVTCAIGGMIAFCEGDSPSSTGAAVTKNVGEKSDRAAGSPAGKPSKAPSVRRWGDPEPEPVAPESPVAAELAEIRARVGSTVPQDWQAFGVAAVGEEPDFEDSVEALESEDAPTETLSLAIDAPGELPAAEIEEEGPELGGDPVPPVLADSQFGEGQGIPFKPSPFQPYPDDWEMAPPPGPYEPTGPFPPPDAYLPPDAGVLPFESPEALRELTKLLSATARDLERLAHVREEQRRYEDADRLRRLAMQLRRENRRLLPEPTPNPAYLGPAVGRR